jgi:hypothetical protein
MTAPVLLVVSADDHPNSTVGLCPPEGVDRDEGGQYLPSQAQRWLWECWDDVWRRVAEKKRELGAEVYWVHCGDGADDNTHSQYGLITLNHAEMVDLSCRCRKPGLDVADRHFAVRGTPAHVGQGADLEELIARQCGAEADPSHPGWHSRWYWSCRINGVLVLFKHRPASTSMRYYTRGGGANRTAVQVEMACTRSGTEIPRAAYYGHYHHPEDSGENQPVRVFFCPPLCLRGSYEHSRGFEAEPVGVRVAICDGGTFTPLPLADWTYAPEEEEPWCNQSAQETSHERLRKPSALRRILNRLKLTGRRG